MDHLVINELENVDLIIVNDSEGPLLDGETDLSFELRQPEKMKDYHWHQQIEVNVIYRGYLEYAFNNANIRIDSGQMVLFWAVTPHKVCNKSNDAVMGIINIPLNAFLGWAVSREFVQQVMHGGVIVSSTKGIVSLSEIHRWLVNYHDNNKTRNEIVKEEIFLMLRRLCSYPYQLKMFSFLRDTTLRHANDTGYKNVHIMLDYIANNHSEDIKVEDIAAHVKLHPKYAMGLFKKMMNVSIKKYLIIMRINHAKVLLGNTRNPIKNIATNSGFKHPSSFFSAFKASTGLTPQEYRERTLRLRLGSIDR